MHDKIADILNDKFWLEHLCVYGIIAFISACLLALSYMIVKVIKKGKGNYLWYSIITSNLIWLIIMNLLTMFVTPANENAFINSLNEYVIGSIYLINFFIWFFGLAALIVLFIKFLIKNSRQPIE